jgi:glycosyltransferase A (GT-A) superfamily protein (DUF2064 family)
MQFAKWPEPGRVKTRLMPALGAAGALGAHVELNLGQRMAHALAGAVQDAGAGVIVGSDCPSVDADYVRRAIALLREQDVVLGPSDDGGYVLIGAGRVVPGMLDDIAWGTEAALEQTCQRLQEKGLRYALLEPRWDVDEPEDWQRWCAYRD